VTGIAGAHNLCVVHGKYRSKHVGVVTILANVTGLNMREVFTDGIGAVVTVDAIARDIEVIEIRR
jgi:hypothetical protein